MWTDLENPMKTFMSKIINICYQDYTSTKSSLSLDVNPNQGGRRSLTYQLMYFKLVDDLPLQFVKMNKVQIT